MSLLSATIEDVTPKGRILPEGLYQTVVEMAGPNELEPGKTQLQRRYGNLRREGQTEFTVADGTTFRIGNRKLFARSWIDHPNADAARIGQQEIKREAIAAGLMVKPEKGGPATELDFPSWASYAEALVSRELTVRVRHKPRVKNGEPVLDDGGQPIIDAEVVDWVAP